MSSGDAALGHRKRLREKFVKSGLTGFHDIESAIKYNAVSLIFAHNHPSGNSEPSQNDKEVTRDLVYAGSIMRIRVLDHIIIGNDRYFSFAGEVLIEEYELDFLNLKIKGVSEAKRRLYRAKLFGQPT